MMEAKVTIYRKCNAVNEPYVITLNDAINRIKNGKNKELIEKCRNAQSEDEYDSYKYQLPAISFSGVFSARKNDALIEHNGLMILDFDHIENPEELKQQLFEEPFAYAAWVSPSGEGVKCLIKIKDILKHESHFYAARKHFNNQVDIQGKDVSRLCFESYDPNILIKEVDVIAFDKLEDPRTTKERKTTTYDSTEIVTGSQVIFDKLKKWMYNSGSAFVSGERNPFIYKLACACCKYGIPQSDCEYHIETEFVSTDNSFKITEACKTISSAYKRFDASFGSVCFEKNVLVTKENKTEIKVKDFSYLEDPNYKIPDVIYGSDCKSNFMNIFDNGVTQANTTHIKELDEIFKWKTGDLTVLTGIGNYGKSTFLKYVMLLKSINQNRKWAVYSPEDFPAESYYQDLVEMYLGMDITPNNPNRATKDKASEAYDFISKHFFYIYPHKSLANPEFLKEKFLELIIKENVYGCIIDPFNQMSHDYKSSNYRDDKYLEATLTDFQSFSRNNEVVFVVIAHPHKLEKDKGSLNYKCPDVFDIAGGAMWNNKAENILVFHRPDKGENPQSELCEIHSKKIRFQKSVGRPGMLSMMYNFRTKRFFFSGIDYLSAQSKNTDKPVLTNTYESFREQQSTIITNENAETTLPF